MIFSLDVIGMNRWDRLSLMLPKKLKDKIRRYAEVSGVSMSAFVRSILALYLSGSSVRVEREMVIVRERRTRLIVDEKQRERAKIWKEVQKELKQLFKQKI